MDEIFLITPKSVKFDSICYKFNNPGGTFFVILRRAIIEAGLVCSPDKDGDRGDVKVFSLLPSFFSLGVDDTLDSLGLLFLATCGSREEHLKKKEKETERTLCQFCESREVKLSFSCHTVLALTE